MSYDDDDDEYDEYAEIDDEYPEPGQGYVGDAETLLRRSIDIIATAPTMPLSSSPRIDRDEIIELLEEALQRLPDELRQARWMLKERQEFVAKTRREADELLEAARVRAERMVQRTEVVRAAEQRARQVMETAEADARRLRHETEDFLDQRLGSFEILLDKLQKTVGAGRQRLSIGVGADAVERRRGGRPDEGVLRPGPVTVAANVAADQRRRAAARAGHAPPRRAAVPLADLDAVDDPPRRRRRRRRDARVDDRRRRRHRHARPWPGRTSAGAASGRSPARWSSRSTSAMRPSDPDAFPIEHGQIDLGADGARGRPARRPRRAPVPGRLPGAVPDVRRRPHDGPCGCAPLTRDERWAVLDELRLDD